MTARSRGLSRRQFVQGFCLIVGSARASGVLSADDAVSTAMAFKPNSRASERAGKVFSESQMAVLRAVCDVVIPETDTPSASQVDVHGFIDNQLAHCYSKSDQSAAITIVQRIEQESITRMHGPFVEAQPGMQLGILLDIEATRNGFSGQNREHFKALKELIVFGYYTTEVGATRALRYDPYPGGFRGKVPLQTGDRTWFRNR